MKIPIHRTHDRESQTIGYVEFYEGAEMPNPQTDCLTFVYSLADHIIYSCVPTHLPEAVAYMGNADNKLS